MLNFVARPPILFDDKAPTLPAIFQIGDRIIECASVPSAMPSGMPVQRVAVLGGITTDYLVRAIACAIAQEGVLPVLHQVSYGAYVQEVLAPASALQAFAAELAVIAPNWRDMVVSLPISASAEQVDDALAGKVKLMQTVWQRLAQAGAKLVQHCLVPPSARYQGLAERFAPAAPANQIARLNQLLFSAGQGLVTWIDMEALARGIGTRRFAPTKFYHTARLDYDPRWLPDYLPLFRAAWRAANARAKKVLVLDLDNTLWGGVIGDDGVDGIKLGPASPVAEAFHEWQHYLKGLAERGVVLAVCSKNDPEIAARGFAHPNSVLNQDDFAAFSCAWTDKAAGLRRIAQDLNLGLDRFVFCDDNPAECDLVRQELPQVAVICLGDEAAGFIDKLDAGCWFDAQTYTREDLGRTAAYAARGAALAEQTQATDLNAYLVALNMTGCLRRATEADLPRLAQLEQKTNQFNVTTRRYSEARISALLTDPNAVVLAFSLVDKFGDHGLTSTLIAVREGDTLRIDSWVMSCRIFARTAEEFILRGLIDIATSWGVKRLLGEFRPTAKNGVVANLYLRLGFTEVDPGFFVREVAAGTAGLTTCIQARPDPSVTRHVENGFLLETGGC